MSNIGIMPNDNRGVFRPERKLFLASADFVVPADHNPAIPIEVTVVGCAVQIGYAVACVSYFGHAAAIKDRIYGLVPGQRIRCTVAPVTLGGATSSFGTYLTAPATGAPTGGGPEAIIVYGTNGQFVSNVWNAAQLLLDIDYGNQNSYSSATVAAKTGAILVDYWTRIPWAGDKYSRERYASNAIGA